MALNGIHTWCELRYSQRRIEYLGSRMSSMSSITRSSTDDIEIVSIGDTPSAMSDQISTNPP